MDISVAGFESMIRSRIAKPDKTETVMQKQSRMITASYGAGPLPSGFTGGNQIERPTAPLDFVGGSDSANSWVSQPVQPSCAVNGSNVNTTSGRAPAPCPVNSLASGSGSNPPSQ